MSEIKIEFSTADEPCYELFKPVPIKSVVPEWYKNLSAEIPQCPITKVKSYVDGHPQRTSKACIPIRDYLTSGYLIVTQGDIVINADRAGIEYYQSANAMSGLHAFDQLPIEIEGDNRGYIKFGNKWVIKTPPGYSCMFYQPEYFLEDRFRIFPGIVDTDKYDNSIEFPGRLLKDGEYIIKAGTPLVCVFPFKREAYTHECKFNEKEHKTKIFTLLYDRYLRLFHSKKQYK